MRGGRLGGLLTAAVLLLPGGAAQLASRARPAALRTGTACPIAPGLRQALAAAPSAHTRILRAARHISGLIHSVAIHPPAAIPAPGGGRLRRAEASRRGVRPADPTTYPGDR
jgi:hypothetical protein